MRETLSPESDGGDISRVCKSVPFFLVLAVGLAATPGEGKALSSSDLSGVTDGQYIDCMISSQILNGVCGECEEMDNVR